MRASEFDRTQIDEVSQLIGIQNWFKGLYNKDAKSKRIGDQAKKAGEAEVRQFTNQHMNAFMKQMGRYGKDWPELTMRVVYQYLRAGMRLSDDDIIHVVNRVTGKDLSLRDIQDPDNTVAIASINDKPQVTAEKIIAAGSLRQLERHWETQAGIVEPMKYGQTPPETDSPVPNNPGWVYTGKLKNGKPGVVKSTATQTSAETPANATANATVDVTPIAAGAGEPIKIGDEIIKPNNPNYKTIAAAIKAAEANANTLKEFDGNLYDIIESATGGATASGSIASVASPMGSVISRTPNLFGYIPAETKPTTKKRKNRRKSAR